MAPFKIMPTAPCFTAPITAPDGAVGVWYAEHWVVWPTREFIVWADGQATVAPYDFAFRSPRLESMDDAPATPDVARLTRQTFEARWEAFAQPRLHALAQAHAAPLSDEAGIHYFHDLFPARYKVNESSSDIYYEFVDGLCRRTFEIWPDQEPLVDGGSNVGVSVFLGYARDHVDQFGAPFDADSQPREISHLEFETLWERHGIPSLHALLQL